MNVLRERGAILRKRRLDLGLSREEAYRNFRVPLTFIAAIEEGCTEGLPPPIYARGFIKTYCESMGLPYLPVLDAYEDQLQRPASPFFGLRIARRDRPKWVDDAVMWAAIAGIVIASWVSYTLLVRPGTSREAAGVQAQTVELPINDPFSAP